MMAALTPRRLRLILGVSLALNLFLVAFVAGQRWRAIQLERLVAMPPIAAPISPDPEGALGRLAAMLPAADAAILRAAMATRLPTLLAIRRDFAAALEQARAAVARDPVDPAALAAAISAAREQRMRFGPILEALLVETVPQLSPEGRRVLSRFRSPAVP